MGRLASERNANMLRHINTNQTAQLLGLVVGSLIYAEKPLMVHQLWERVGGYVRPCFRWVGGLPPISPALLYSQYKIDRLATDGVVDVEDYYAGKRGTA